MLSVQTVVAGGYGMAQRTLRLARLAKPRCSVPTLSLPRRSAVRLTGFTGHPVGEKRTNIAVGMDKGRQLTKRELPTKPSHRKGVRSPLLEPWRSADSAQAAAGAAKGLAVRGRGRAIGGLRADTAAVRPGWRSGPWCDDAVRPGLSVALLVCLSRSSTSALRLCVISSVRLPATRRTRSGRWSC